TNTGTPSAHPTRIGPTSVQRPKQASMRSSQSTSRANTSPMNASRTWVTTGRVGMGEIRFGYGGSGFPQQLVRVGRRRLHAHAAAVADGHAFGAQAPALLAEAAAALREGDAPIRAQHAEPGQLHAVR